MQLNPARGRKLDGAYSISALAYELVYAAQPREGTETGSRVTETPAKSFGFMQLNPARGRKLEQVVGRAVI